jgi:hypothetical protein
MPTRNTACPETDAAYPESKTVPLRLARYCNAVILPHERLGRQNNEKGVRIVILSGVVEI